jgi:hypothetical protein
MSKNNRSKEIVKHLNAVIPAYLSTEIFLTLPMRDTRPTHFIITTSDVTNYRLRCADNLLLCPVNFSHACKHTHQTCLSEQDKLLQHPHFDDVVVVLLLLPLPNFLLLRRDSLISGLGLLNKFSTPVYPLMLFPNFKCPVFSWNPPLLPQSIFF